MTRAKAAPAITLDDLPLFADDRELARAIVGPDDEKIRNWLASLPSLESSGLPKRHTVYGRYVPGVRQFYDRQYGCAAQLASLPKVAVVEEERPWPRSRKSAHRG